MGRWKQFVKTVVILIAAAFIPPLLLLVASTDHVSSERLLATYRFSLVYACSIGGLNFLTIPRLWGRVHALNAWLRWPIRVGAMFVNTLVGSLLACLILLAFGWIPQEIYWIEFWASLKMATFITILVGLSIGIYESFQWRLEESALQLRTKELERERALKLATEAQLASLESRIHPHFLFNTLNSISSLIPEDPERAEKLVEQMAALLRFSLDANQAGLVPLAAELKVVGDYLEIERARFGDRLRYRIDVAADLENDRVPALAVQTLVENSVKYAVAPNRAGGEIRIASTRENGCLRVAVMDEGPGFRLESAPRGHGLDNLKDRLATLFGDRAALGLDRRENGNSVILTVPQNGNAHTGISG
jgi:two-component system sensor histidine kinase AlgZ